jgi:hypothetical protein
MDVVLLSRLVGLDHSPSLCCISQWKWVGDAFVAGIKGEPRPEVNESCDCPCRRCQKGWCNAYGFPPLSPRQQKEARAVAEQRQRERWATQKVFEDYDMPPYRTPDSFRYVVEILHAGHPVDTYYTDHSDEANRLVGAGLKQCYEVRVLERDEFSGNQTSVYGELEITSPDAPK